MVRLRYTKRGPVILSTVQPVPRTSGTHGLNGNNDSGHKPTQKEAEMPEIEWVSISCTYCMGNPAPWGDMGPICPTCDGSGFQHIQRRYECEKCGWVDFTPDHKCFAERDNTDDASHVAWQAQQADG